jgi:hypothetical protein
MSEQRKPVVAAFEGRRRRMADQAHFPTHLPSRVQDCLEHKHMNGTALQVPGHAGRHHALSKASLRFPLPLRSCHHLDLRSFELEPPRGCVCTLRTCQRRLPAQEPEVFAIHAV